MQIRKRCWIGSVVVFLVGYGASGSAASRSLYSDCDMGAVLTFSFIDVRSETEAQQPPLAISLDQFVCLTKVLTSRLIMADRKVQKKRRSCLVDVTL